MLIILVLIYNIIIYIIRFEQILILPGHNGCLWGLDITSDASQLFSCGQDRSIRMWIRTDDLVFIEEER